MIENCLPVPYKGSETGKWVHFSIVERLPAIIERIISENEYDQEIESQLKRLRDDIPYGLIRPLNDSQYAGKDNWDEYITSYQGMNWLDIPWFFAELYFYRRVLEATKYFLQDENERIDPYQLQKNQGLINAKQQIQNLFNHIAILKDELKGENDILKYCLKFALWGNQADLSLWPVSNDEKNGATSFLQFDRQIIIDESDELLLYINSNRGNIRRMDIILDNVGIELVSDLNLANYLLTEEIVDRIYMHVKRYPLFVSDAMGNDVMETVETLSKDTNQLISDFGQRLQGYLREGHLKLKDHPFWVSPLPLWKLPESLSNDLMESQLIIVKGDANFRRILGDLHWCRESTFTSFDKYLPASLVALRVLKSEIIVGIKNNRELELWEIDPDWMINGRWGIIQFAERRK
ncbi:MAG: damage-control phosphatase ARMT1 family protein [Anaerolineaceae bacterium]|nr:damage-control phosphatase ARMT1 family protein [Anaerolineaceae bacterium]